METHDVEGDGLQQGVQSWSWSRDATLFRGFEQVAIEGLSIFRITSLRLFLCLSSHCDRWSSTPGLENRRVDGSSGLGYSLVNEHCRRSRFLRQSPQTRSETRSRGSAQSGWNVNHKCRMVFVIFRFAPERMTRTSRTAGSGELSKIANKARMETVLAIPRSPSRLTRVFCRSSYTKTAGKWEAGLAGSD